MKNLTADRTMTALILSADLAKGCNWAHPSRVEGCRPHNRCKVVVGKARTLLAGSVLVMTSLLSTTAFAGPLTDAVAASLGKSVPAQAVKAKTPSKVAPAKSWQCGQWIELWQGSGSGRTCEWR